jgi:carbohydrate kinase (thermoresistant glucokinase family)
MQSPLIYIMGVSGSGKTTVGKLLSAKTEIPFFDGDDLHSSANKKKMEAGNALNDDDRKDWLQRINSLAIEQQKLSGAIIACSALKEKYRDILIEEIHKPYWVFLNGGFELIQERMKKRKDHFMPTDLLSSQFEILERPSDALTIDISKSPEEIVSIIQNKLQLT